MEPLAERNAAAGRSGARRSEDRNRAAAPEQRNRARPPGRLLRVVLVTAGTLCVGLGMIGIVVPLLPTTPFLLLAGACYVRSSERMHRWLFANRLFGEYLRRYRAGEGLPLAAKVVALVTLWIALLTSAMLVVRAGMAWLTLLLAVIGIAVTIHILRLKTRRGRGAAPGSPPA